MLGVCIAQKGFPLHNLLSAEAAYHMTTALMRV